jgi:hypothetical protein
MHEGVFSFFIEARKRVPKALLSFAPVTLELIKAPIPSVPAPSAQRSLTQEQDPQEASVALKKPFDPGGAIKEEPKSSKAQLKRAGKLDPQRFKLDDQVMTKEGPAVVIRLTGADIPIDMLA